MVTTSYEAVLEAARQLTPEEQQRLGKELVTMPEGLGARFIAYLASVPFDEKDRADLDAMKQAIEEGCERIDNDTW